MSVLTGKYNQFQEGFRDAHAHFQEYLKNGDSFPDDPEFYKDACATVDDLSELAEGVVDEGIIREQAGEFLEQVRFVEKLARVSGHMRTEDLATMAVAVGDFITACDTPDDDLPPFLRGVGF